MEKITAKGHVNVSAKHKTTLEVTADHELTPRGDCIIAVSSNKGAASLSTTFKDAARSDDAMIRMIIACGGLKEEVVGFGSKNLTFTHPRDLVVRKSNYCCGRTVMIMADKAAADLDRRIVEQLKKPQPVEIILIAERRRTRMSS
ncbi:MAG: DUF371 domain-containing protein [Candidatus Freyarchaeota archaeon]|nr:DUF371 domain-containing protein [Candidatus Jordarchaeia archaeon]